MASASATTLGDRRFTYDWRNRLIQVDGYGSHNGTAAWYPIAAYVYDAFDRLVVRFSPEPGAALQGDGPWMAEDTPLDAVQRYAHAPGADRIVAQYDGVVGHGVALSTSNTWLWYSNRVYAYGPYIDEPVALLDEDDGGGPCKNATGICQWRLVLALRPPCFAAGFEAPC